MKKNWWETLSYDEQVDYLKNHPNSKRKVTRRKPRTKSIKDEGPTLRVEDLALTPEEIAQTIVQPTKPKPGVLKSVLNYAKTNKGKIALALAPALMGMGRTYDQNIENAPREQKSRLAGAIRTAVTMKDNTALKKLSRVIGVKTGVVLLGLAAVTLLTGTDMSFFVPLLVNHDFWPDFSDLGNKFTPDEDDAYLKEVGRQYLASLKENAENPTKLAEAAATNPADRVFEERRQPKLEAASNHETDLYKALQKIEKLDIVRQTEHAMATAVSETARVRRILTHIDMLEHSIPRIASILIAAVPQKLSLSNRAKTLLSTFNNELTKSRSMIAEIAAKQSLKRTPLSQIIRGNVQAKSYHCETAYVLCEDSHIRLCEHHKLQHVEVGSTNVGTTNVYAYVERDKLHIACINNSEFTPKSFDRLSLRSVGNWLKETGLAKV